LFLIGAAAACGAVLWIFLHPERPLQGTPATDPVPQPTHTQNMTGATADESAVPVPPARVPDR
jgi:MFS transporter, ACS family, glucarate transporter